MDTDSIIRRLRDSGADTGAALERFVDDEELYYSCLISFFNDKNYGMLKEALAAEDYNAAHTLKGVAGNLGLNPLYKVLCALVESLRAQEYDGLTDEYDAVQLQTELLKNLIKL